MHHDDSSSRVAVAAAAASGHPLISVGFCLSLCKSCPCYMQPKRQWHLQSLRQCSRSLRGARWTPGPVESCLRGGGWRQPLMSFRVYHSASSSAADTLIQTIQSPTMPVKRRSAGAAADILFLRWFME